MFNFGKEKIWWILLSPLEEQFRDSYLTDLLEAPCLKKIFFFKFQYFTLFRNIKKGDKVFVKCWLTEF